MPASAVNPNSGKNTRELREARYQFVLRIVRCFDHDGRFRGRGVCRQGAHRSAGEDGGVDGRFHVEYLIERVDVVLL
ncbi:MAG: hypothetical protein QGI55_16390 [Pseudomonadales bacterium]|nr:hypothetical protein [Pseudomonadales bacterium]